MTAASKALTNCRILVTALGPLNYPELVTYVKPIDTIWVLR